VLGVRDTGEQPPTITGADGKAYPAVTEDTQLKRARDIVLALLKDGQTVTAQDLDANRDLARTGISTRRIVSILLGDRLIMITGDGYILAVTDETLARIRAALLADPDGRADPEQLKTALDMDPEQIRCNLRQLEKSGEARRTGRIWVRVQPAAERAALRAKFDQDAIALDGPNDDGAWHRALDLARHLVANGIWDSSTPITLHNAQALHDRVFGVTKAPITDLVYGQDYTIDTPTGDPAPAEESEPDSEPEFVPDPAAVDWISALGEKKRADVEYFTLFALNVNGSKAIEPLRDAVNAYLIRKNLPQLRGGALEIIVKDLVEQQRLEEADGRYRLTRREELRRVLAASIDYVKSQVKRMSRDDINLLIELEEASNPPRKTLLNFLTNWRIPGPAVPTDQAPDPAAGDQDGTPAVTAEPASEPAPDPRAVVQRDNQSRAQRDANNTAYLATYKGSHIFRDQLRAIHAAANELFEFDGHGFMYTLHNDILQDLHDEIAAIRAQMTSLDQHLSTMQTNFALAVAAPPPAADTPPLARVS
jgi:hypothetical protein